MSRIPAPWLPRVPMKRIICHWTAGTNKAGDVDKKAYHILIEGDGTVVRGTPSISANSETIKDGYAAHTLNCNTDSIGVSMCGMAGAIEAPFKPGAYPLTKVQWDTFIEVVAELAKVYGIPVTPKTILFHAEVQSNLGITQKNKWDVTRLIFEPNVVGAAAVGNLMRSQVQASGKVVEAGNDPIPVGAILKAVKAVKTRSTMNGPDSGLIPADTTVEVMEVTTVSVRVETPGGYLVWADRQDFIVLDGPKVEEDTKPDKVREAIQKIRAIADELEASLS